MKINLESKTTVEEKPILIERFQNCIPCNWIITTEGDTISAVNDQSKETFKGSIADFNRKLRG
jgi:hypothetical protein